MRLSRSIMVLAVAALAGIGGVLAAPHGDNWPDTPVPPEPPPGDRNYIVTDLDVFDDASASSEYMLRLQQQMHALDCCAIDIPKLFSGFRLQTRGYQLAPYLSKADQGVITKMLRNDYPPVRAVNRHHEAVGAVSRGPSGAAHGYLIRGGKLVDLGTLGGRGSEANAINNCGQIVGASQLMFDTGEDVFVYQAGVMKDLGPGHANAISDNGQVAGQHWFDNAPQRAALWVHGKPIELCDEVSEALAINNAGAVVGECSDHGAFLYQNDKRTDLRDYIGHPRRPGVRITDTIGAGINDAGQIIVYEYEIPRPGPSDEIAYLLTPITGESREKALQSVTPQERELWLSRCNRLAELRSIANEDRQKFLDWCSESDALPYLKPHLAETQPAHASCVSLNEIVPADVEDAEIPYRVRIPVSAERFVAELAKLADVSGPQEAADRLGQALNSTWRKKKENDLVWWELKADAHWNATLRLTSDSYSRWVLSAGNRLHHDQLVFRESGKARCLRLDLVDRVLKPRGFKRSDYDMPIAGPYVAWEFNDPGGTLSIQGAPKDRCLPALLVRSVAHARTGTPKP
jgi:probable HAF family extracellular repeat protein